MKILKKILIIAAFVIFFLGCSAVIGGSIKGTWNVREWFTPSNGVTDETEKADDGENADDKSLSPISCSFDNADGNIIATNAVFEVTGKQYACEPYTVNALGKTFTSYLKMESATTIKFVISSEMELKLYANTADKSIKVDGVSVKAVENLDGDICAVTTLSAGEHVISKGDILGVFNITLTPLPAVKVESVSLSMAKAVAVSSTSGYLDRYTLFVEAKPSYARVLGGQLSMSWVDPNSSWAKGKTVSNYLSYDRTGDGIFEIYFKQAFSESVNITFVLDGEKTLTTTRRVECVGSPVHFWNDEDKYVDSFDEVVYLDNFVVEGGTIAPDRIYGGVECELDSGLYEYLQGKGYSIGHYAEYYPAYGYGFSANGWETELTISGILTRMFDGEGWCTDELMRDIAEYVRLNIGLQYNFDIIRVSYWADCSYNGTDYGSFDEYHWLCFNSNVLSQYLSEVE